MSVSAIANKNGAPLQIPKEDAKAIRAKMGAAIQYSTLVDKLIDWRAAHGWESKTWNSADLQEAKSLLSNLQVSAKNAFQLGALSASDMELVDGAIGTGDPGSMRDPTKALLTGRKATWDGINSDLQANGYDGHARVEMPPSGTAPAANSTDEALLKSAQERRTGPVGAMASFAEGSGENANILQPGGQAASNLTGGANEALVALAMRASRGEQDALKAIAQIQASGSADQKAFLQRIGSGRGFEWLLPPGSK